MNKYASLQILLLQARNADDVVKKEELVAFADKAGLPPEQFTPHDLLAAPPTWQQVRHFDAVMIGGSGDYYVSKENLPHLPATLNVLADIVAQSHPMFASCFGFQLVVAALGGKVIFDPDHTEVGTFEVTLTDDGEQDELLGKLPTQFKAQLGRKDRAAWLPDEAIHLAGSERCPFQALRLPGKPIWATQFHPEMSGAENRSRFDRYRAGYGAYMNAAEQQRIADGFKDSPETKTLIPNFIDLVFA